MTQPNKPQPKDPQTYEIHYVYGYNHGLFEMEAYYLPIVMELLEVLEDIVNWDDVSHPNHTSLKYPFLKAKQSLEKYKELK